VVKPAKLGTRLLNQPLPLDEYIGAQESHFINYPRHMCGGNNNATSTNSSYHGRLEEAWPTCQRLWVPHSSKSYIGSNPTHVPTSGKLERAFNVKLPGCGGQVFYSTQHMSRHHPQLRGTRPYPPHRNHGYPVPRRHKEGWLKTGPLPHAQLLLERRCSSSS
jgi:hypothetical protein